MPRISLSGHSHHPLFRSLERIASSNLQPTILAGFPATIAYAGTSRETTARAATTAPSPTVTPDNIVQPDASQTSLPMMTSPREPPKPWTCFASSMNRDFPLENFQGE